MDEAYAKSKSIAFLKETWANDEWNTVKKIDYGDFLNDTGVIKEDLLKIGLEITKLPVDAKFHPQIVKIFKAREQSIIEHKGIDWGTAEALAFATLIN